MMAFGDDGGGGGGGKYFLLGTSGYSVGILNLDHYFIRCTVYLNLSPLVAHPFLSEGEKQGARTCLLLVCCWFGKQDWLASIVCDLIVT